MIILNSTQNMLNFGLGCFSPFINKMKIIMTTFMKYFNVIHAILYFNIYFDNINNNFVDLHASFIPILAYILVFHIVLPCQVEAYRSSSNISSVWFRIPLHTNKDLINTKVVYPKDSALLQKKKAQTNKQNKTTNKKHNKKKT